MCPMSRAVNAEALLDLAMRGARAAGTELMNRYGHIQGLDSKTSATDPVSDADRAAETILVDLITGERPDDGLLGEEGAARESTSGIRWVIDPARRHGELPLPAGQFLGQRRRRGRRWRAGRGCLQPDQPQGLSRHPRGRCGRRRPAFAGQRPGPARPGADRHRIRLQRRPAAHAGRAGRRNCCPRCGTSGGSDRRRSICVRWRPARWTATSRKASRHWDVAAGGLIAREAGAKYVDFTPTGAESGCLAAGPALFKQLHATLRQVRTS